ncbi:MAG: hypothetical protein Q9160_002393 [Pyrenula sp. 1 TL-2023]
MKDPTRVILLSCAFGGTLLKHASALSKTSTQSNTASTCPARAVNYLTHSLVQQCHTSTWKSTQNSTLGAPSSSSNAQYASGQTPLSTASDALVAAEPAKIITITAHSPETTVDSSLAAKASESSNIGQDATSSSQATGESDSSPTETDAESPLESGNFLSFEEWKKQNLANHGQSGDHIGRGRQYPETRKRPSTLNTALDSLDDDAEIELNFPGFTPEMPNSDQSVHLEPTNNQATASAMEPSDGPPRAISRSKDAGKTCKERFNYASFDCAANVLKWNPQASGPSSVLVENKDSYMLNQCSAENKFIILELCDDIAIDTIVLANYEFFSSIFRSFRVSVSDRYPAKLDKWKTIGTYEARNSREVQAFLVENPIIWARYLRIEFLTHYGNEFYCPISLVRVHGTTMLEDYKRHEDAARAEEEGEEEASHEIDEAAASRGEILSPEAVADAVRTDLAAEKEDDISTSTSIEPLSEPSALNGTVPDVGSTDNLTMASPTTPNHQTQYLSRNATESLVASPSLCPAPTSVSSESIKYTTTTSATSTSYHDQSDAVKQENSPSSSRKSQNTSVIHSTPSQGQTTGSSDKTKPVSTRTTNKTSAINYDTNRTAGSATQPSPANPTIQESFFKSVQKRLQMLESNSSLSLQYIEDQSRILRDAFTKVEQRQLAKTTSFIDYLNSTVLSELRDFRQQYDQIWQSTVIELEGQRQQYQRDMTAMNARLGMLAEEVVFQKRLSILQSILVLLCLGLVLFSRGGVANYLELPIVQNVMGRSQSFRFGSGLVDTPIDSPLATRPGSAFRSLKPSLSSLRSHSRTTSSDSRQLSSCPATDFTSTARQSEARPEAQSSGREPSEESVDEKRDPSPSPSLSALQRPGTSPAALPSGTQSIDSSLAPRKWDADRAEGVFLQSELDGQQDGLMNGVYIEDPPEDFELESRGRSNTIRQHSNKYNLPVTTVS